MTTKWKQINYFFETINKWQQQADMYLQYTVKSHKSKYNLNNTIFNIIYTI